MANDVCSTLYMSYVRTQIYLTEEQRARLSERAQRQGVQMARVIREAIDLLLASDDDDVEATFGAAPGLRARVPSRDEWQARG